MEVKFNDSDYFSGGAVFVTKLDGAYVILNNVTSFCSILGSLGIVCCYMLYRDIRSPSRKLLLYLSIANFCLGISGILQTATYFKSLTLFDERSVLCQAAGFLNVYSSVCSFLWTDTVSFYLLMCVTLRSITIGNKVLVCFHIFCWIMPGIVALSAGMSDVFGYDMTYILRTKTPVWCWISDRVENQVPWYFMTIEGWALFSLVFCMLAFLILTISVLRQSKRQRAMDQSEVIEDMAIHTVNKQLRYVPAIFFVLRFWASLYFLAGKIGPNKIRTGSGATGWLLIMKGICDNSQGFANFILFCFTTNKIKQKVKRWFSLHCNLCRVQQKQTFDGSFSAPRIFRVRGKYEKRVNVADELHLTSVNLDLPTTDHSSMIEDEVVFERD